MQVDVCSCGAIAWQSCRWRQGFPKLHFQYIERIGGEHLPESSSPFTCRSPGKSQSRARPVNLLPRVTRSDETQAVLKTRSRPTIRGRLGRSSAPSGAHAPPGLLRTAAWHTFQEGGKIGMGDQPCRQWRPPHEGAVGPTLARLHFVALSARLLAGSHSRFTTIPLSSRSFPSQRCIDLLHLARQSSSPSGPSHCQRSHVGQR